MNARYYQMRSAILRLDIDGVRRLLDAGADVNMVANKGNGDAALAMAVIYGAEDICALLIDRGANVNGANHSGVTTLGHAMRKGGNSLCTMLVESGASPTAASCAGVTPLHEAAHYVLVDVCEMLLAKGADIGARDRSGSTPLHWCVRTGKSEVCQLLLEHGANPNATDQYGSTPLHYATDVDSMATKENLLLLLEHGASSSFVPVDAPHDYLTPFQSAVRAGMESTVMFFCEHSGEDPGQLTIAWLTMAQLAGDNLRMQRLLRALATGYAVRSAIADDGVGDANPSARRSTGMSPL